MSTPGAGTTSAHAERSQRAHVLLWLAVLALFLLLSWATWMAAEARRSAALRVQNVGVRGADGAEGAAGLDGADGSPGMAGSAGVDGSDGTNGATGATGLTGPAGPAGSPGPGSVLSVGAGEALSDSGTATAPILNVNVGAGLAIAGDAVAVAAANGSVAVSGTGIAVGLVDQANVDFGTGLGQVSAADLPIVDAGLYFGATDTEGALQELGAAVAVLVASVTAGDGLLDSGTATDPVLDLNVGDGLTTSLDQLAVLAADGTITVTGAGVAVGIVGDANISFGTAAGEVSASDLPIADAGLYFGATETEGALQELGAFDAALPTDRAYAYKTGTTPLAGAFASVSWTALPSAVGITLGSGTDFTIARTSEYRIDYSVSTARTAGVVAVDTVECRITSNGVEVAGSAAAGRASSTVLTSEQGSLQRSITLALSAGDIVRLQCVGTGGASDLIDNVAGLAGTDSAASIVIQEI